MNAPIVYFGGKNGMAKHIIDYFPDKETYNTYIEPFGGSYGVGLHMDYIPPIEIYNDLNNNVYSLYKVLQDGEMFKEFQRLCELSPYCDSIRNEYVEKLKDDKLSLVERAYMFFYVNRTSHNGIGGFSMNCVVRRNMSKSVSDMLTTIDNLFDFHNRISKTIISSTDGISLIKKYGASEKTFMYCDPPYHHSTRTETRYDVDMDDDMQEKFIDACIKAKCKLLISGYACDAYKRLEENGFKRIDFVVHTVRGKKNITLKDKVESLWMNYEIEQKNDSEESETSEFSVF